MDPLAPRPETETADPTTNSGRTPEPPVEGIAALAKFLEEEGEALVEHLDELRWRLIVVLAVLVVGSIVGWSLVPEVLAFFQRATGRLVYVAPAEAFFARLKIAAAIGLLLTAPFALFQMWRFVLPALFPEEKRLLRAVLWMGLLLFFGGFAFGLCVVYPTALRFLLSFGTEGLRPAIVVTRHLGFFLGTTLSFGIAFQLPVLLWFLVRLGVLSVQRLRRSRKEALFLCFVAAGALTPADALTQVMMAVPLALLYELALIVAPWFERRSGSPGNPV